MSYSAWRTSPCRYSEILESQPSLGPPLPSETCAATVAAHLEREGERARMSNHFSAVTLKSRTR